jgi:branched-chain amino acid transport system permease protein|tara:strand:+ start:937 stop:1947 length:1011 start_codon:yes stop_codon:yes gene_type:complete
MIARTRKPLAWAAVVAALAIYPNLVPNFWVVQIGALAFILGIIALSLTFLAAYGGMISLAQMTIAGIAGYMFSYFSPNFVDTGVPLAWPWAMLIGLGCSLFASLIFGLVAVRTQGIYFLMITLAIAVGFFYFARSNDEIFNAWDGFRGIDAPVIGGLSLAAPKVLYYLSFAVAGLSYLSVLYLVRTPFGLAMQGIRDNPRRMAALGYWVGLHRVLAFVVGGAIASLGGILFIWYHSRISSGTIGLNATIDILVICVIGGLINPLGAFIGSVVFVLIDNFAIDLIDRERFNTVMGMAFLLIVLFSPDGLIGIAQTLWQRVIKLRPADVAAGEPPTRG